MKPKRLAPSHAGSGLASFLRLAQHKEMRKHYSFLGLFLIMDDDP